MLPQSAILSPAAEHQVQVIRELQNRLTHLEDLGRNESLRRFREQQQIAEAPPEPGLQPPINQAPVSQALRRWDVVSSGVAALDRCLPERGFRRGTLVEWLAGRGHHGSGAGRLALATAREALRRGGALVVFDRRRQFYPPAAVRLGIDPARLIVVRADSERDEQWALHQACAARGVAAVVWWGDRLDAHHYRRLQLACEQSLTLGIFIRPRRVQDEPSWAETRWLVEPRPSVGSLQWNRRLQVRLLKCRGAEAARAVELEINERTGACYEAPVSPSIQNETEQAQPTQQAHPLRPAPRVAHRPLVRHARRA